VRTQLKDITFKTDEIMRERNSISMELKTITQVKEDLERRAAYNEKLSSSLSEDLVREKNDKEVLLEQLNKLREDNVQMRLQIKDLESTKATLYRKLDSLEQERNTIKKKLGEAESAVSERVEEIVKIKNDLGEIKKGTPAVVPGTRTVELAPIIVHGKQEVAKPTLTGRVLSLNKENEFVIIDLGNDAGVKVNDKFNVYRDNKFIGSIEVIMMRKDISAADIKEIAVNEEIKTGDIVKLTN
jgi:predicted nuclease with TOPRIM domain